MVDWITPLMKGLPILAKIIDSAKKKLSKQDFEKVLSIITKELLKNNPNYSYIESELERIKDSAGGSPEFFIVKDAFSKARSIRCCKKSVKGKVGVKKLSKVYRVRRKRLVG